MIIFVFGLWINAANIISLQDGKAPWSGSPSCVISFVKSDWNMTRTVDQPCDVVARTVNEATRKATQMEGAE